MNFVINAVPVPAAFHAIPLETRRLVIRPTMDAASVGAAFQIATAPGLREGMAFPKGLSLTAFTRGLGSPPKKVVYLLRDRVQKESAGLVIIWLPMPRLAFWQILYGILPAFRGQGFALEAAREILGDLFTRSGAQGAFGIVEGRNPASTAILLSLGMRQYVENPQKYGISKEEFTGAPTRWSGPS